MKNIFCLLLFLNLGVCSSQTMKLTPSRIETVVFKADEFIGLDGFSNSFFTKNNVLYKNVATSLLQYQNVSLGKITKVDLTNPLKIVVFYEEFNSVVILDNQLNEIQKLDFSKLETPIIAAAVGICGQNKLWIFNSLNQQLGLYDLNTNLYQIIGLPIKDGISYYETDFNYFQWVDKQNQWKICTIYGRIFPNGKVEANSDLQFLDGNKILFLKDNILYIRDRNIDKLYEIEIVEKSFKKFYYKDQILSIFTDQGITNYKITLP
ncbi:hypothetical protein OX283_008380 [Flavobacterium sp. SUN052]|uniref:hypothetical protein n=1 Tax=Flavobacterium sp. SUN052 TaxID=3002441 RepID=UPI00237D37A0|nr:hypothetical protein [Flavobacterium sp. SUN052]MEC4004670.1 hypothetical protein [Flavobacterium sp. SUN052]